MFATEEQLVTAVSRQIENQAKQLPSFLKKHSQLLLNEVGLGYGVADIVIANKAKGSENRTHFLNDFQVSLFNLISR